MISKGGKMYKLATLLVSYFAILSTGLQPVNKMQLTDKQRAWFRNPDGSCVQCSIGMCGTHTNTPEATTLLWDTQYGPKVRGGSGPSRVAGYMNTRKIKGWNITGKQTYEWMRWSCKTGRFAAIGAGGSHFQTLYGFDPNTNTYYVCNNNSTHKIDEYNESSFRRLHESSGEWVVILEKSNCENPEYFMWWTENNSVKPHRIRPRDTDNNNNNKYPPSWPVDKPNAPEIPIATPNK